MPDDSFWIAVDRLCAGSDAGEDIEAVSERLLEGDQSLGDQLQEALASLDAPSLAEAVRLSDAMGATEDAMIAVGCAVIASGPDVYREGVRAPETIVMEWDLSRGDLLLALNPAVTLSNVDESVSEDVGKYSINMVLGNSALGWAYRITDAIAYQHCRRVENTDQWRAIFARWDAERLLIHLHAAPGNTQKVGKPRALAGRYLEVDVTWNAPRSLFKQGSFVESILNAVATRLERR